MVMPSFWRLAYLLRSLTSEDDQGIIPLGGAHGVVVTRLPVAQESRVQFSLGTPYFLISVFRSSNG